MTDQSTPRVRPLKMTPYRHREDGTVAEYQLTAANGEKFFLGADKSGQPYKDQEKELQDSWRDKVLALIE